MTTRAKQLALRNGYPGGGPETIYTCPADTITVIKSIFTYSDTLAYAVVVLQKAGGAGDLAVLHIQTTAGHHATPLMYAVMNAGDTIYWTGNVAAADANVHVAGAELPAP